MINNTVVKSGLIVLSLFLVLPNAESAQFCLTNITLSAPDKRFIINNDETVTDLDIGLMWQRCIVGTSGLGCAIGSESLFTWESALTYVETVNNSNSISEYNDWRLPNVKELTSLIEVACKDPSLNINVFPIQAASTLNWTSSPYIESLNSLTDKIWGVQFTGGIYPINGVSSRATKFSVRLVRGGDI